ncbi:PHP domain-containing protein [Phormidium pseudopriestleyi FRX01]|uniref:PHP domain-containing protein n=1 Tax=Phormidium pseudopriestleyi FRX01 TaxID=1759528 RepID=A0ABS3FSU5_9CYAN|nr:PHP domain-containing protein [Phormidium pseudopriestleyi]MBO0350190.1 PHP domain-containing protein [Phormidium pseudopriestleyi FRX01]
MLELHCHTTYSDGTLTPTELVEQAVAAGVRALAITDHDTMSGWPEAIAKAESVAIEIVPGLELSTVHNGRSLHILGFYPDREKLQKPLNERLQGRIDRAQQTLDKLAALGYPVELPPSKGGMAPGRPHIAAALLKAGYIKTCQEAFERWIGEDKPAYVHYDKFSIQDGINLLRSCGAVPVWAHPYLFRGGPVETVLKEMVEAGLMGVEVYHPHHTPNQVHKLEQFCAEYGLLMTGGSDYHGPSIDAKQSSQLNQFHLPLELLEPIKIAAQQLR